MDGGSIRIRYEDIRESDVTTIDGIRVTTALRARRSRCTWLRRPRERCGSIG